MINPDFDDSHVRQRLSLDLKARIKVHGGTNAAFRTLQDAGRKTGFICKADYVKIVMAMELAHDRADHAQFFHAVQRNFGAPGDPGIRYGAFLKYVAGPGRTAAATTASAAALRPPQQRTQRSARPATTRSKHSPPERHGAGHAPKSSRRMADQVLSRRQLLAQLGARMRAMSHDPAVVERHLRNLILSAPSSSPPRALRSWRDLRSILFGFRLRVSDVQVRDVLDYLCLDPAAPLAGARPASSLTLARLVEMVHGDGVEQLQQAINSATLRFRGEHTQVQQRDANRFADEITDPDSLRATIHKKVKVLGTPWRAFVDMSLGRGGGKKTKPGGGEPQQLGISLAGFTRAVDYLQIVTTRECIQQLFHDIDADGSGFIEQDEFVDRLYNPHKAQQARSAAAAVARRAAAIAAAAAAQRRSASLPAIGGTARRRAAHQQQQQQQQEQQGGAGLTALRAVFQRQEQKTTAAALLKLFKVFAKRAPGHKITTAHWKPAEDRPTSVLTVEHGVTFNGFKAALKASSAHLTDEEIRQAFVACDINADGVVDFFEFAKAVGVDSKGFEYGNSKLTPDDSIVRRMAETQKQKVGNVVSAQSTHRDNVGRTRPLQPGAAVVEQYKVRAMMARQVLDVFSMHSRDAAIDFPTFSRGVDRLGMRLSGPAKRALFHALDHSRDGHIDYNEFADGIISGQIAVAGFNFASGRAHTQRQQAETDRTEGSGVGGNGSEGASAMTTARSIAVRSTARGSACDTVRRTGTTAHNTTARQTRRRRAPPAPGTGLDQLLTVRSSARPDFGDGTGASPASNGDKGSSGSDGDGDRRKSPSRSRLATTTQRRPHRGLAPSPRPPPAGVPLDADSKLLQGLTLQLLRGQQAAAKQRSVGGSAYVPRRKSDALDMEVKKKQQKRAATRPV